jgi:hypothetical protein
LKSGRLEAVTLPYGDLEEGFGTTSEFSYVSPGKEPQTLTMNLETDSCGTDGFESYEYEYRIDPNHSSSGSFHLASTIAYDCDWKNPKPIWQRKANRQ